MANSTSFRPGPDPRRHRFSRDECKRGGKAGFLTLMEDKPWLLLWLRKKLRAAGKYTGGKNCGDAA